MKLLAVLFCAVVLFSLQLSVPVHAAELTVQSVGDSHEKIAENPQYDWLNRFKPYGMNYGVWQLTKGDEQAMDVQYSFKYILYNCERFDQEGYLGCRADGTSKLNGFFAYTGKFDFYMFTRGSSPVINRVSNPALHAKYDFAIEKTTGSLYWADLSVEHRSNGQVVEVDTKDTNPASPTFNQYLTEIEYQKGNREYFDRISRDANYVKLATGWQYRQNTKVDVGVKLYFTDDSDITWGPYAGTGVGFKDFDLVQLKAYQNVKALNKFFPEIICGLEYLIGRKGLATDSLDLYLITPFIGWGLEIPFMVKAHFGPMDRLSDYSRSINSFGAGFIFSY